MRVSSEEELAEAVRDAGGPLRIRGGGTRPVGRPVAGAALDVSGLCGIRLYEPGALTLVAAAGTPLAEIEAALAGEGQRLAFEPADWRGLLGTTGEPTLGGVIAANVSGPRRVQAGAARDALLGVRFVDGRGTVVKNGGRVMKNVTGYDLVKLMAGSWGTLGVLSEVSLKVLPAPEAAATLAITGLDDAALRVKTRVVAEAVARHADGARDGLDLLTCLGGREIAAVAGAIAAARMRRIPVLLDGFICGAAAACLARTVPGALDHCLAGHLSAEQAHGALLDRLGLVPLLALGLRLGEGSGAALAIQIVQGALACHGGMATFAEAGVSDG